VTQKPIVGWEKMGTDSLECFAALLEAELNYHIQIEKMKRELE